MQIFRLLFILICVGLPAQSGFSQNNCDDHLHFAKESLLPELENLSDISTKLALEIPLGVSRLKPDQVQHLLKSHSLTMNELLLALIPVAKRMAIPSISEYFVGVVGLGKSGAVYFGVNLEFPSHPLNQTIHGEQFLIAVMHKAEETGLQKIALSAQPCGHCRQFMNELESANDLQILVPGTKPKKLSEILPDAFGPKDLGFTSGLLVHQPFQARNFKARKILDNIAIPAIPTDFSPTENIIATALKAAQRSYAPFSKAASGVAIQTSNGNIYSGSYIENAAFNPSLSPFQTALADLISHGESYDNIVSVLLVEKEDALVSHRNSSIDLYRSILSPDRQLIFVRLALVE